MKVNVECKSACFEGLTLIITGHKNLSKSIIQPHKLINRSEFQQNLVRKLEFFTLFNLMSKTKSNFTININGRIRAFQHNRKWDRNINTLIFFHLYQ